MTFAKFSSSNPHMRQGQAFLLWAKAHYKEDIKDTELFQCRSDEETWNIINLRYSKYLNNLV